MHLSALVIQHGPIESKRFTEEEAKKFNETIKEMVSKLTNFSYMDVLKIQIMREKFHWFCGPVADRVDKILDKYYVDCDNDDILEFEPYDDDTLMTTWNTTSEYFIKKPNGTYTFPKWNDNFIIYGDDFINDKTYKVYQIDRKNIKPNSTVNDVLKRTKAARKCKVVKKKFSDVMNFEEFKEIVYNIKDYRFRNCISINYGNFYNPYGIYNSYAIGGLQSNIFLVKEDNDAVYEIEDLMKWNPHDKVDGYKWVTAAYVKDIDFDKMKEVNGEEIKTKYIITEDDISEDNIYDIKDSLDPYDIICAVDMHI